MANVFSNFGLMMQGADTARKADLDRELETQRIESAKQGIETQKQAGVVRGQQIEQNRMGLEDLTRERSKAEAVRKAAMTGSFLDMADAAESSGDPEMAFKYRKLYKAAEDEGLKNVVDAALKKPQAGYRPDLGEEFNRYGKSKVDPQSVTLDTNGMLSYQDPKTGQRSSINVGVTAERMGMIAPPKIQTIPAGGVGVITQPGRPTRTITAPKTFAEKPKEGYITRTEKDSEGNERQQIIDVRPGSPTYGEEVAAATGPATGGAPATNIRKDRAVLQDITKGIAELGDEYAKTDMTNPLNPRITLTPKGQQVALIAEQIRLSNQRLAPRTIIDMAVKGKPMWKIENGKRTGVVIYNGAEYPMATPKTQ